MNQLRELKSGVGRDFVILAATFLVSRRPVIYTLRIARITSSLCLIRLEWVLLVCNLLNENVENTAPVTIRYI